MKINRIDIVCHSHFSLNSADNPVIVSQVNKKIIDKALDAISLSSSNPEGSRFCWTAESFIPVLDWWKDASQNDRKKMIDAINNGSFEVCATPYNMSSLLDASEIKMIASWLPDNIYEAFNIKTIVQSGVDGISASLVNEMVDKNIKYVWVMPQKGGSCLRDYPFLFNWKITAYNRVIAFEHESFGNLYEMLFKKQHPDCEYSTVELNHGLNKNDDLFAVYDEDGNIDKPKLAESFVNLSEYVKKIEDSGKYLYSSLPVSLTGFDRASNSMPSSKIIDFVSVWNKMGFTPKLNLTTASTALYNIEVEAVNNKLPTFTGQWLDTVSKRFMQMPKEVSLSRKAALRIKQESNVLSQAEYSKLRDSILKDLCQFHEHNPSGYIHHDNDCLDDTTISYRKYLVERAFSRADYIYSEKLKSEIVVNEEGVYVYNPSSVELKTVVSIPCDIIGSKYVSIMDNTGLEIQSLNFFLDNDNKKKVSFCVTIPPRSVKYYAFLEYATSDIKPILSPEIETDINGWPLEIKYGSNTIISASEIANITAIISTPEEVQNEPNLLFKNFESVLFSGKYLLFENSRYNVSLTKDMGQYISVKQDFENNVFGTGVREMIIWKNRAHVNVNIRLHTHSNIQPCAIFAGFNLNTSGAFPVTSNGGLVFDPSRNILSGSGNDIMAIDGWVSFPYNKLIWLTKDSPLVTFGEIIPNKNFTGSNSNDGIIYSLLFDSTENKCLANFDNQSYSYSYDIILDDNADDFNKVKNNAECAFTDISPILNIIQGEQL